MPTYLYETIPASQGEKPIRFEVKQSMKDDPLERHPETGKPVKRVITGGYGFNVKGSDKAASPAPTPTGSCCAGSCGCSHN